MIFSAIRKKLAYFVWRFEGFLDDIYDLIFGHDESSESSAEEAEEGA
jgi:hypothetical protein